MNGRRGLLRVLLLAGLLATLLGGLASPAAAHGRGTDVTNYDSRITDAPPVDGLRWRVYGGDELLWVENTTEQELVVYGYERDPVDLYLRIGPDGVWENRSSPAAYLNRDRLAQVAVPDDIDPAGEPDWVQVSDQPRYAWHDHRIHYMGVGVHPRVTDPGERTHVMDWTVPFAYDGEDLELAGELEWVPGPSPWPWLLAGLVLTAPALAGLRSAPVDGGWPGLARPAAVVLGAVVAANAVFVVDDLTAVPLPLATQLFAAAQTLLFVGIGAFGAVRGWQAGDGAFTALGVGAGALLVGQGLLLWPALSASQLATVFPEALIRSVIGLNVMQALPLGVVAYLGTQRLLPDPEEVEAADPVPAVDADPG